MKSMGERDVNLVWWTRNIRPQSRSQGYETFFMLISAEHEIFPANKYENANNSWHYHIY